MGIMAYFLLWVVQDLYHQPYHGDYRHVFFCLRGAWGRPAQVFEMDASGFRGLGVWGLVIGFKVQGLWIRV